MMNRRCCSHRSSKAAGEIPVWEKGIMDLETEGKLEGKLAEIPANPRSYLRAIVLFGAVRFVLLCSSQAARSAARYKSLKSQCWHIDDTSVVVRRE